MAALAARTQRLDSRDVAATSTNGACSSSKERAASLYLAGLTLTEIGGRLGVTRATVGSWLRDLPVDKRAVATERRRVRAGSASREREAVTLYRSGLTLAQIGDRFGVTRERARQLIQNLPLETRREIVARRKRAAEDAFEPERALDLYARSGSMQLVSVEMQVPYARVRAAVRSLPAEELRLAQHRGRRKGFAYDDRDLLLCLRHAAALSSGARKLTLARYTEITRERTPPPHSVRRWPPGDAIRRRWGTWVSALVAAGVAASPSRGSRQRFTLADCDRALRAAAVDTGTIPTIVRYREWHRQAGHRVYPSSGTIVSLHGGSFRAALLEVFGTGTEAPRRCARGNVELAGAGA